MPSEKEIANSASWRVVESCIAEYPDEHWQEWRALARDFLSESFRLGLDRHFRAGTSMHHLVFSTLDHYGLRSEPRVTVEFHPEKRELRVAYGCGNLYFAPAELEYTLPFDSGFSTFRRFLKHLWTATSGDPFPEEIEGFSAPILS
jgi:hypothetical protein